MKKIGSYCQSFFYGVNRVYIGLIGVVPAYIHIIITGDPVDLSFQ